MAFRVNLREADGALRGLDVFAGILRDGRLYLMGEVGAPFRPEWLHPLSEVTLEGRVYPAPAAPERLLEAMYGPHWRTPDPAFKFETSEATRRRLDGWFRGTRGGRALHWSKAAAKDLQSGLAPSRFLKWVRRQERDQQHPMVTYLDLGCGSGVDVFTMARQGVPSWGLDFRPSHFKVLASRARRRELPATYRWTNFNELRSVLPTGAEVSRTPGPRVVTARHLADALDAPGRDLLLRFAEMATRDGGRFYLQVLRATEAGPVAGEDNLTPLDVESLVADIEARGGRVFAREDLVERPGGAGHTDISTRTGSKEVTRLGVAWDR
jgi:SAM-dependent methyltransferase